MEAAAKHSDYIKKINKFLKYDSFGDLLHYETYDESYGIYVNPRSLGFILEIGVFTGSNEELEKEFAGLFQSMLPEGSSIQFLLIASSKIDGILDYWENIRKEKAGYELINKLAEQRKAYFTSKALSGNEPYRLRDFKVIVSCSLPHKSIEELDLKNAKELRKRVETIFAATGTGVKEVEPSSLIQLLDEILNYDGTTRHSYKEWNKYQPIREQILDLSSIREITEQGMLLNSKDYEYRCYSVRRYPNTWFLGAMGKLIGDNLRDLLKIPCPFIIHYGVYIDKSKLRKAALLGKGARVESQAASILGKWIPSLIREAQEWSFVRGQFEQNERLVKTHFQVLLIDRPENISGSESLLQTLYRSNGWEIGLDKFITASSLVSMLPLSWAEGMQDDMSYFKKAKTTLSHEPVNLLPISAEWKGTQTPAMLLAGKKGQVFYWNPFDANAGNYNVGVVGRSGSGKSVFMQELATGILGIGGHVYVLDVGRSFEKQVKLFGGQFIEFSTNSSLCLNPFTTINAQDQESVDDSLSVLKPIISLMVAPKAGTTDIEDSIIERGLYSVWQERKNEGCIDDLAQWLAREDDKIANNLSKMLFPYSKKGAYGRFFNGKGNIDFSSKFIVTELQELKERKDLQSVVVQILILLITNKIILGGRKYFSSIIFDEAWDLLKGKQGGAFIEALARTLRKFKGSLVVGTQSLNDFYASPGAEAAFNNIDWLCMLSQKKESIELLKKSGKFFIDEYTQKVLGSIRTKHGEYAEVMIMAEGQAAVGRLILDPFSRVLYSTKAEEYVEVKQLEEQGLSLAEAIRTAAERRYGSN